MKKIFSVALMVLLGACAPVSIAASSTSTGTDSHIIPVSGMDASSTSLPVPSRITPTGILLKTSTPTQTNVACLHLIRPANGANLSTTENVEFAWEPLNGAQTYVFSLNPPGGLREESRTTTTKLTRSIKETSKSGFYQWSVSAYDAKGRLICSSSSIRFSRLAVNTGTQTHLVLPQRTKIIRTNIPGSSIPHPSVEETEPPVDLPEPPIYPPEPPPTEEPKPPPATEPPIKDPPPPPK